MTNIGILGSGMGLGTYVPALLIRQQLSRLGLNGLARFGDV